MGMVFLSCFAEMGISDRASVTTIEEGAMDWDEVVAHLRTQYQVGPAKRPWVELWRSFREGAHAIRQQQTVRSVECHGEAYCVIEAEIAVPAGARAAVCASAELAMGTLVERGDALVAHTQVPASALTPAALDRILLVNAREAMRLSMQIWQRQRAAANAAAPDPTRAERAAG